VIEDALKLLEGRLKNIKIVTKYNENLQLYGYKTEFSQVILNILNNAVDVLNERNIMHKKIIITLDKDEISIEDNGGGIDEKIKKFFEPYFTTKFQNQGTGIGLYMSKIIITKHFEAKLLVENSKIGAIFKIIF
jgi:signal transduction histidine kinase